MSDRIFIKPKQKKGGACRCHSHSCRQGCHHDRPNDGWCPRGKAAGYRLPLLLLLWCWGQTQHLSLELSWVRRKRAGPTGGLRPTPGRVRWGLDLLGFGGFQRLKQPDGEAQGLICRIEKHMVLSSPSRNVDKIAEMDLRWEMGSLFNTGKRGDEVVEAVF